MASPHTARREHGVCMGSLWQRNMGGVSSQRQLAAEETRKAFVYCVLVGVTLTEYADYSAYRRGDHPMSIVRIVGASAWNKISSSTTSTESSSTQLETSFRMVTSQGTHFYCEAPSQRDCECWLGALHGGLETSLAATAANDDPPVTLPPLGGKQDKQRASRRGPKRTYCTSCGRECVGRQLQASPLPQYGFESRNPICPECLVCQGMLLHVQQLNDLYRMQSYEENALKVAREHCLNTIRECDDVDANIESEEDAVLVPTPASAGKLSALIQSTDFGSYRRVSQLLNQQCTLLQQGSLSHAEFIESLQTQQTKEERQVGNLKRQAFRVAGDMGAAMKLLQDHALNSNDTDMLSYILDFLLDLADEGELSSVAFFWPQLRSIHLRMLPPRNAEEVKRVDMVEDFLLTVAVKYSVQLALELIWGHVADLEDSLYNPQCSSVIRRRRFAVLRFVCELESLLFDFEFGWGGGSVSLRSMLRPSPHQVTLLRQAMIALQNHRQNLPHLSRSVRMEKLKHGKLSMAPEEAALEALRVARNADYFSSHLSFTRRLCDIAEKLRFMEVENRASMLQKELISLNTSGTMGGDPLNRVQDDLINVVRIPTKEGHVFRSKERTPVLLLVEVMQEGVATDDGRDDSENDEVRTDPVENESSNGVAANSENVRARHHSIDMELPKDDSSKSSEQIDEAKVEQPEDEEDETSSSESSESFGAGKDQIDPEPVPEDKDANKPSETQNGDEGSPDSLTDQVESETGAEDVEPSKAHESKAVDEGEADKLSDQVESETRTEGTAEAIKEAKPSEAQNAGETAEESVPDTLSNQVESETKPEGPSEDKKEDEPSELQNGAKTADQPIANKSPSSDKSQLPHLDLEESSPLATHPSPRALGKFKKFDCPDSPKVEEADVKQILTTVLKGQPLELPTLFETPDKKETDTETEKKSSPEDSSGEKLSGSTSKLSRNPWTATSRRVSAFSSSGDIDATGSAPNDEIRREVLTTIMIMGKRKDHLIAARAAASAQRSLQDLDRKRAVEMILQDDSGVAETDAQPEFQAQGEDDVEVSRRKLMELGLDEAAIDQTLVENIDSVPDEEDEAMESLRLLLLQNRVEEPPPEMAAPTTMAYSPTSSVRNVNPQSPNSGTGGIIDRSEMIEIEAGDVDPRLAGCGALPPNVLSALTLWKAGVVSNGELLELVKKDMNFIRESAAENSIKLMEDSKFWGRFAFGERWAEKKARLAASSPESRRPGWDLLGVIVKSNDDLRQESFVMQLIELCQEAFDMAGLELWLHPYRILATGRTTGIIEMVRNAMSFDALKKRPGYGRGGLLEHLKRMTEFTADPKEALCSAQRNFVQSLAAYSLLSYLFLFKDRHNGNILLDTSGHVIHIDFGFVFGVAPGGSFSLEMSTPFKLTEEMVEVMGGLESPLFSEFVTLFCCGFLALQAHVDTFATIVEISCHGSSFKCFEGRDAEEVVSKLRERFAPDLDKEASVLYALDLIKLATQSYGTKQYDYFQYLSQGIAA